MLTHSFKSGLSYELHINREPVAKLQKKLGGFVILTVNGAEINDPKIRTMKATKVLVEGMLPAEMLMPAPVKPKTYSLKEAAEFCNWSHTARYIYPAEVKKIWPEMRRENYGAYFMRSYVLAILRNPCFKDHWMWAKRWLAKNPTLGWFDEAEERRRIEAFYGPQPDWSH